MLEEILGKSKNKKQVVAIGLLAGALFLGWNFMARPMLTKIKGVETGKTELAQKETVFRSIVETEKRLERFKPLFVGSKDKTALIGRLSALAAKSSLVINAVTPEEQASLQSSDFEKVNLRIEAMGNYHALGQFVSRVENLEHFAKIIRLEIGGADLNNGTDEFGRTGLTFGPESGRPYKISVTVGFLLPAKDILS